MDADSGIRGRDKEVQTIHEFISSRLDNKTSGILYLAGPPGTGKSMSISYVLDSVAKQSKTHKQKATPISTINCAKSLTSKCFLTRLCESLELKSQIKSNESDMTIKLHKKLTGKKGGMHIIVLEEMDWLPRSKCMNLVKSIFSWPSEPNSNLILIGIANTVNLNSRSQVMSAILGKDYYKVTKVLFRPYSSEAIKSILEWYLENDENYEDAHMDSKVLDMISKKFARENGDIRGALNALKSAADDTAKKNNCRPSEASVCRESTSTNIATLANSIKKRQRPNEDDKFSFPKQLILKTIQELTSNSKDHSIDTRSCYNSACASFHQYELKSSLVDFKQMLDIMESSGLITIKDARPRGTQKIILRASEYEIRDVIGGLAGM